ncbi:MAG TPA: iron-containing alcohol dehydrogenase [Firmicutes bacterium]|nr:iron-containing alcohol dehydrogenase [Candidatus Fermentithermobacillaceae bacterium]
MDIIKTFSFELPTKIEYGMGVVRNLPDEASRLGARKVMVVTDRGVREALADAAVIRPLKDAGFELLVFDQVEPNPKDRNVEEGAALAREFGAEALVALGGGSPIDCAKAIAVLVSHGGDRIKKYEGKTAVTRPVLPWIAIPTTAGTGSEVTFSSVITDTAAKYKMTIKSPFMAAKVALVDPELTFTVPPAVTASTGVDALTHAIEAYTVTCSEPISDALALHAISLIAANLRDAVRDGRNARARDGMMMGSLLAGIAFSHSDVGSVHCMAESLGGVYDLPHGVCNAILLPYVMEYNMEYCRDRYANVARAMGAGEDAASAVQAVKALCRDVGLPALKTLGIRESDLDMLADMSARNISTESNPRPMTKKDYLEVFRRAME